MLNRFTVICSMILNHGPATESGFKWTHAVVFLFYTENVLLMVVIEINGETEDYSPVTCTGTKNECSGLCGGCLMSCEACFIVLPI